ncbi:MAG: hypothetical protein K2N78_06605, partial [Oscillospiraceae bacterium]|nr:hypothetical protein [Oscillospiraceae bacterium]
KISVHSGQLPYTTKDIAHKIQSFIGFEVVEHSLNYVAYPVLVLIFRDHVNSRFSCKKGQSAQRIGPFCGHTSE